MNPNSTPNALLEMRGISIRFGAVQALDNVDLTVRAGEIHTVMGENGAGKSTLLKILTGVYKADAGEICLDGKRITPKSPSDAQRLGVSMVYQEVNLVPYLTGQVDKSPRNSFIYVNDDQQITALRYENWKLVFMEQRAPGTLRIWAEPFVTLRLPKIFNLRIDPYERADVTSNTYYDYLMQRAFVLTPAQAYVGKFLETFKEFPQRQKAASFNLDEVMETLGRSGGG